MIRRRDLFFVAAGVSVLTAGCFERTSREDRVSLLSIRLFNEDETVHDLEFAIANRDGETVFTEQYRLDPNSLTVIDEPVAERGTYRLAVTVGEETSRHAIADSVESGDACARATIRVVSERRVHFEAIGYETCDSESVESRLR